MFRELNDCFELESKFSVLLADFKIGLLGFEFGTVFINDADLVVFFSRKPLIPGDFVSFLLPVEVDFVFVLALMD
jgi:hypothetical protein